MIYRVILIWCCGSMSCVLCELCTVQNELVLWQHVLCIVWVVYCSESVGVVAACLVWVVWVVYCSEWAWLWTSVVLRIGIKTVLGNFGFMRIFELAGKLSWKTIRCTLKGKAIPLQTCTGLEGSRSLRLPRFPDIRHMKVTRLSGYQPHAPAIITPSPKGNSSGTHFC